MFSKIKPTKNLHVTIFGENGLGKTSLAASFPDPVFLKLEDGSKTIEMEHKNGLVNRDNVTFSQKINNVDELYSVVNALLNESLEYKTIVVDSVTKLDSIFTSQIIAASGKQSINQAFGGYGAGVAALVDMHVKFKNKVTEIANARSSNVVYIAHADVKNISPPDSEEYTKYVLRMNDKCFGVYVDEVDAVAFIRLNTYLKKREGRETNTAITDNKRKIICYPTPNNMSKNRLGITQDLDFTIGENPFAQYL